MLRMKMSKADKLQINEARIFSSFRTHTPSLETWVSRSVAITEEADCRFTAASQVVGVSKSTHSDGARILGSCRIHTPRAVVGSEASADLLRGVLFESPLISNVHSSDGARIFSSFRVHTPTLGSRVSNRPKA